MPENGEPLDMIYPNFKILRVEWSRTRTWIEPREERLPTHSVVRVAINVSKLRDKID
jgi:hypothetical protein